MDPADRNRGNLTEKSVSNETRGEKADCPASEPSPRWKDQEILIAELRTSLNEAIERALIAEEKCDDLPLAFLAVDRAWRIIDINEAACRLWGKTKEGLLGSDYWSLVGRTRTGYDKYISSLETNTAVAFEQFFPLLRKWLKVRVRPSRLGLRMWFRDLTEERSQAQAHARLWGYYKSLADNVPDIILRFDTNLRCLFANRTTQEMLGTDATFLNKHLSFLGLPPDDVRHIEALLQQAFATGKTISEDFEVTIQGVPRYISWRFVPEFVTTSSVECPYTGSGYDGAQGSRGTAATGAEDGGNWDPCRRYCP